MNKCDLEETKRQIEDVIEAAIADESGWEFLYYGEVARYLNTKLRIAAERYRESWRVSIGHCVFKVYPPDTEVFFETKCRQIREDIECNRLLKLLTPEPDPVIKAVSRPWWKFWS